MADGATPTPFSWIPSTATVDSNLTLDSDNAGMTTSYVVSVIPNITVNSGVAVIGANNVSDYESWCENRPALNPNKVVPFWTQTSRYTLCVDEFYKEWFAKLTANNPYFAKFGDVTIAERNRQLGGMWQKEWMNSFFWGKRIANTSGTDTE